MGGMHDGADAAGTEVQMREPGVLAQSPHGHLIHRGRIAGGHAGHRAEVRAAEETRRVLAVTPAGIALESRRVKQAGADREVFLERGERCQGGRERVANPGGFRGDSHCGFQPVHGFQGTINTVAR